MTQRKRLVELILDAQTAALCLPHERSRLRPAANNLADYLLNNGVIVPPFRIGEDVYCISPFRFLADRIRKDQPYRIDFSEEKGFVFVTFTGVFYENEIFKTKEEAEAALKELDET